MSTVGQKIPVHLLVRDPNGKIKSGAHPDLNNEPATYKVACTPNSHLPRSATGEAVAVTCPLCKATPDYQSLLSQQGATSAADAAAAAAMNTPQPSVETSPQEPTE